ncbi:hypothetical protein, partial [uncultured Corynebacterium sp.]|uniref:hypothetical protein n=1 Tax=uncultured Corynebacterium sp. TaxID=159447 RepID=UPI0025EA2DF9
QLFHGAQYAVWSDDLPAAVTMLEKAVRLPGVSPQNRVNHFRTLAQLTGDLGRTEDADRWQSRADELEQTLEQTLEQGPAGTPEGGTGA